MAERVYTAGQRYRVKEDGRIGKILSVTFSPTYEIVMLTFFDHPMKMGYLHDQLELVAEEEAKPLIEVANV